MPLQLIARTGHPDFLDLPWHLPLAQWQSERLVEVPRGISRHVVRFVNYDGTIYALKELPSRFAEREYCLLRRLAEESIPVVEAVGVISNRGPELDSVLITRHLVYSLPYRALFASRGIFDLRTSLLDALAQLLARLHLAGFFWGDCSLSNTLFRRDAGALSAYLVDAETGEMHATLTGGQRAHDLAIAEENIIGELLDVEAEGRLPPDLDPDETAEALRASLRVALVRADARGRLRPRRALPHRRAAAPPQRAGLRRRGVRARGPRRRPLPAAPAPARGRAGPPPPAAADADRPAHPGEPGAAPAQRPGQLPRRASSATTTGSTLPESVVAYRWLSQVFEPTIAAVPAELRGKLEPAELFHEILEHRGKLSEQWQCDVPLEDATALLHRDRAAPRPRRAHAAAAEREPEHDEDEAYDEPDGLGGA